MEKTYPYEVEVTFSRVLKIEATGRYEAEQEAKAKAWADLQNEAQDGKPPYALRAQEWKEPIDWSKRAEEDAEAITDDVKKEILEKVEQYKRDNPEIDFSDTDEDSESVSEIWDEIYQDEDISQRANEYADGSFIYTSNDAVIEALNCINELSEYEETDSGLWEGEESAEQVINIRATYTLGNAIMAEAERAIKRAIVSELQRELKEAAK